MPQARGGSSRFGFNAADKKKNMRSARLAVFLWMILVADSEAAASWQYAAGATLEDGGAVEVSGRAVDWELAAGYVSEQRVRVNYITPQCPYAGAPADSCMNSEKHVQEAVSPYAYLSLQRRFEFRQGAYLRPQAGLGVVAQSDTNEYVSSPVNFSLSLGLAFGDIMALEWRHFSNAGTQGPNLGQDTLLLRFRFE